MAPMLCGAPARAFVCLLLFLLFPALQLALAGVCPLTFMRKSTPPALTEDPTVGLRKPFCGADGIVDANLAGSLQFSRALLRPSRC